MLCTLLNERGPACAAADARAVPLSVDRFGMRVRFCDVPVDAGNHANGSSKAQDGVKGDRENAGRGGHAYGYFDVRFEFPDPVEDVAQLRRAMRILFDAATE